MFIQCALRNVFPALASVVLVACGGGGGGGGQAEGSPSQAQALFDESTLASQGGSHQILASHIINPTGPSLFWAATASLSMDQTPSGKNTGATATPGAPELLLQTAAAPNLDFSDNAGQAVIARGGIHFLRNNAPSTVRHAGDDVLIETETSDGEYTRREQITAITKHVLRGRLDAAPEEFRAAYRTLLEALRGGVRFPDGAAYYKRTSVRVGTLVVLQDSDFNAATDPQSATAFTTGTIEDVPPRDPAFAVLCEVGNKVYLGSLQPDGAVLGGTQPGATTMETVPFSIRLNQPAVAGLRSMVP